MSLSSLRRFIHRTWDGFEPRQSAQEHTLLPSCFVAHVSSVFMVPKQGRTADSQGGLIQTSLQLLIQQDWSGACKSASLSHSQGCWCCWSKDYTLKTVAQRMLLWGNGNELRSVVGPSPPEPGVCVIIIIIPDNHLDANLAETTTFTFNLWLDAKQLLFSPLKHYWYLIRTC